MLSILHVLSTLSPRYGGPVQVCLDLAQRQAAAGHRVSIYTTNVDHPVSRGDLDVPTDRVVDRKGVMVRYFPVEFRPLLVSLGLYQALGTTIRHFDIAHVHGIYRFPQFAAGHHAYRGGVPYWVRPYGSLDPFLYFKNERRLLKRIYEHAVAFRLLNRASAIHYTTEDERIKTAHLKLRAQPIVLPNGVESAPFMSLPPRGRFRARYGLGDEKLVMHFGRITMKKGLDLLTAAVGRLAERWPELRLAIVGPDNEHFSNKVQAWLRQHGIEHITFFTGMLEGREKLEALRDADVFALPSYAENFGISAVEAMAAGTPVVISDQVGIWREVKDHRAGLVVTTDAEALAEALGRLLATDELRRAMGDAARRFALDFYAWDRILPRIEDGYRRTIAEFRARDPTLVGPDAFDAACPCLGAREKRPTTGLSGFGERKGPRAG